MHQINCLKRKLHTITVTGLFKKCLLDLWECTTYSIQGYLVVCVPENFNLARITKYILRMTAFMFMMGMFMMRRKQLAICAMKNIHKTNVNSHAPCPAVSAEVTVLHFSKWMVTINFIIPRNFKRTIVTFMLLKYKESNVTDIHIV